MQRAMAEPSSMSERNNVQVAVYALKQHIFFWKDDRSHPPKSMEEELVPTKACEGKAFVGVETT